VCGDRVRKGWWCTLVARPLFELDSETKPTGRPCRPPSLRHRPRRVGSARLAQEAEGRCHRNRLIKQTRLGEAPHAPLIGLWRDRREAVFLCVPSMIDSLEVEVLYASIVVETVRMMSAQPFGR